MMQYEIVGTPFPAVVCRLAQNESMHCESNGMAWMSPNMEMDTNTGGGIGKLFGRAFSGESLFHCTYTARQATEAGVDMNIFFQKKMGSGFFGGEGFIMQRFSGSGMAFLEISGSLVEYDLQAGQTIVVDTGYLAAMDETCSIDVQMVKGVKNMLFGGEGLFNTRITGPGHIWLQTMPASTLAGAILPFLPPSGN